MMKKDTYRFRREKGGYSTMDEYDAMVLKTMEKVQKEKAPSRTVGGTGNNISITQKGVSVNAGATTTFQDMKRDEQGEVSHAGLSSDQYNMMFFADSPTDM